MHFLQRRAEAVSRLVRKVGVSALEESAKVSLPDAREPDAVVPCDGCTLCCKKTVVLLMPEDAETGIEYVTEEYLGQQVLAHKPNGECHYLTESGCSIHGKAPHMCRVYSCIGQFKLYTREQRRELIKRGIGDRAVFKQAARLLQKEKNGRV